MTDAPAALSLIDGALEHWRGVDRRIRAAHARGRKRQHGGDEHSAVDHAKGSRRFET